MILASRSPRRRELLDAAGIGHRVCASDVDETILPGEDAIAYVTRLARDKALAVECGRDEIVLGADTTVVCAGRILGKPEDLNDARRMLRLLQDARHEVITGICVRQQQTADVDHDATTVWFGPMGDEEIESYIASGEPMDKAGAYAIQGIGSRYIERIEGSYSNVVGLPVALVWLKLRAIRSFPS